MAEEPSFFGLIVKPDKRYESSQADSFRITKACLEPSTAGDVNQITSLFVESNSEEFIVANLSKRNLESTLNLEFSEGEDKVAFKVSGPGTVHITGNILREEDLDMDDMMGDDSEEEEDMTGGKLSLNLNKRKLAENTDKSKKIKVNGKAEESSSDDEESSDDDEDDEEDGMDSTLDTTRGDLDSTNNFAEEEDSDDDDDSGEEDDEEEDDDDDDDTDDDDEEDDDQPEEKKKTNESKKELNGSLSMSSKNEKLKAQAKTPQKEVKPAKPDAITPKPKTPKPDVKTPKPDAMTPKPKTPKPEAKTPKPDAKTPKPDAKTPKGDAKTPKGDAKTPKPDAKSPKQQEPNTPKTPKSVKKGGVIIEDIKIGTGQDVKKGRHIGMYYCGRLKSNNKQFDACQSGKPFKFRLGAGEVIKGWDVGLMGMKVGGKRRLTIPAPLAYGSSGAPPDIPGNATLVFDVECKFTS